MACPRACSPAAGKVTRASRNDVAVDADAKAVVVLILDLIDRSRLGRAGQSRERRKRPVRCRFQLLVDHIEAHIEPRCEVVLGPGADRPPQLKLLLHCPLATWTGVNAIEPGVPLGVAKGLRPMFGLVCALQIARLAFAPYSNRP